MADLESDLVERKESFDGDAPRKVRQAICAFANDLPDRRRPGVVFIGARDDGEPSGLEINDALLLTLAHCKTDGNILPLPTMTVAKHRLRVADVAVVTVAAADSPPVRYGGRICVRVGPRRRAVAGAQDERILNEKRRRIRRSARRGRLSVSRRRAARQAAVLRAPARWRVGGGGRCGRRPRRTRRASR